MNIIVNTSFENALKIKDKDIIDLLDSNSITRIATNRIFNNKFEVCYYYYKYTYYLGDSLDSYLRDLENFIKRNNIMQNTTIVLTFMYFKNYIENEKNILNYIDSVAVLSRKLKICTIFEPNYTVNASFYSILLKKRSNLKVFLNLRQLYKHDLSITTYYRLFKPFISTIEVCDIEDGKRPALLGYGIFDLVNFFKNLLKDGYKGDIIYFCNVYSLFKELNTSKFIQIFNTKKRDNIYLTTCRVVSEGENKKISFSQLFSNQIDVLKIMTRHL